MKRRQGGDGEEMGDIPELVEDDHSTGLGVEEQEVGSDPAVIQL